MVEVHRQGVIFALYDGYKIQLERRIEDKRGLKGYVIIPGGGIEGGETEEAALKREIRQEYGVDITFYKKLGTVEHHFGENINHGNVYIVTNWVGEPVDVEQRSEHIEATLEEAHKLCQNPVSQEILDLLDKELSR